MKTKILLFVFVVIALFSSCSKDEAGPQGVAGTNGTNGNANVQSSIDTVINWSGVGTGDVSKVINVPGITQSILDKGIVMVYRVANPTFLIALPYSDQYDEWFFEVHLGSITIDLTNGTPNVPDPGTITYRVVIIAGN